MTVLNEIDNWWDDDPVQQQQLSEKEKAAKEALQSYRSAVSNGKITLANWKTFGEKLIKLRAELGNPTGKAWGLILKKDYPELAAVDRNLRGASVWLSQNWEQVTAHKCAENMTNPCSVQNLFQKPKEKATPTPEPKSKQSSRPKPEKKLAPDIVPEVPEQKGEYIFVGGITMDRARSSNKISPRLIEGVASDVERDNARKTLNKRANSAGCSLDEYLRACLAIDPLSLANNPGEKDCLADMLTKFEVQIPEFIGSMEGLGIPRDLLPEVIYHIFRGHV